MLEWDVRFVAYRIFEIVSVIGFFNSSVFFWRRNDLPFLCLQRLAWLVFPIYVYAKYIKHIWLPVCVYVNMCTCVKMASYFHGYLSLFSFHFVCVAHKNLSFSFYYFCIFNLPSISLSIPIPDSVSLCVCVCLVVYEAVYVYAEERERANVLCKYTAPNIL